jgi:hypothetical protein
LAIDPERVGLKNIEVPAVCDFGDNALDYMTTGGRWRDLTVNEVCDHDEESESDDDSDNSNDEESLADETSSCSSDDSVIQEVVNDYSGILPSKFITFLTS